MFGDNAARLSGLAASLLGWRPDEFWRATPTELVACLGLHGEQDGPLTLTQLQGLCAQYPDGDDQ